MLQRTCPWRTQRTSRLPWRKSTCQPGSHYRCPPQCSPGRCQQRTLSRQSLGRGCACHSDKFHMMTHPLRCTYPADSQNMTPVRWSLAPFLLGTGSSSQLTRGVLTTRAHRARLGAAEESPRRAVVADTAGARGAGLAQATLRRTSWCGLARAARSARRAAVVLGCVFTGQVCTC